RSPARRRARRAGTRRQAEHGDAARTRRSGRRRPPGARDHRRRPAGQTLARLRTAAVHFEDAATFFPVLGRWEGWQVIKLTRETTRIHIDLEPFHVLARRPIAVIVPGNGIGDFDTTATVRLARDPGDEL